MSCIELLDILSKPWANVHDIMKIMNCGRDGAIKMRDTIIDEIHKRGKEVPKGKAIVVPMQYLVKKLNIDLEYLTKIVKTMQYLEVMANDTQKTMPVYQNEKTKKWKFRTYTEDVYGNRKQFERKWFDTKKQALQAEREFKIEDRTQISNLLFSELWEIYKD